MMMTMYSLHSTHLCHHLLTMAAPQSGADIKMVIMWTVLTAVWSVSYWVSQWTEISPKNNTTQYLWILPSTQYQYRSNPIDHRQFRTQSQTRDHRHCLNVMHAVLWCCCRYLSCLAHLMSSRCSTRLSWLKLWKNFSIRGWLKMVLMGMTDISFLFTVYREHCFYVLCIVFH